MVSVSKMITFDKNFMKNKTFILFATTVVFLGFTGICSAATIFTDNFNGYANGSIGGQGGWTGSGGFTTISQEAVFEGTGAVKIYEPFPGAHSIEKSGVSRNDGRITLYVQAHIGGTTHPAFEIRLKEGNITIISVKATSGFGSSYYDADIGGYSAFGIGIGSDTWHAVQIEWRSSDHKARYRIDDGAFTDWHGGLASWSQGLNTVNIGLSDGVGFVDTIQENLVTETKTPVLIVPGLMGTEMKKGEELLWADVVRMINPLNTDSFMDPLQFYPNIKPTDEEIILEGVIKSKPFFNYTENLINEFENQGYTENENLFTFPYDWRYGVSGKYEDGKTNTDLLAKKIQDIITQTGSDKVDVVAHSQGGLIVKKYVADNTLSHRVGKAVFVGVPNTGTPEAVKVLLQGDSFGIPGLSDSEMKKISENLPTTYDLLPSQKYYDTKGSFVKVVDDGAFDDFDDYTEKELNYQEFESYLTGDHSLNSTAFNQAEDMHSASFDDFDLRTAGVDLYAIDGCKTATIHKIVERRFENIFGQHFTDYRAVKFKAGDGTVPLESSTNLPIDAGHKFYLLTAEHGKMLSQDGSRQQIVNLLTGSNLAVNPEFVTQDINQCALNGKAISVFSPIDIFVTDQDDNHLGLASDGSVVNQIPNAGFEVMGDPFDSAQGRHTFLYLPTDDGQVYKIKIKGTGTGNYTITSQDLENSETIKTEVFSNLPVTPELTGEINLGEQTTLTVKENSGSEEETIVPSSVINAEQSEDLASPISTTTLSGKVFIAGEYKGQYKKEVIITINAQDRVVGGQETATSGVLDITYNLDNAGFEKIAANTIDIIVNTEGHHSLSFFATDNAGNSEAVQTIQFAIKKDTQGE